MSERSNNFSFLIYPDSLPDYWQEFLIDTHCQVAVSPCHNMDKFNDYDEKKSKEILKSDILSDNDREYFESIKSGSHKKPHYHCIVQYGNGSKKSVEQVVQDFCKPLNAPCYVQAVRNMRGQFRYLFHLDNPEKHQYPVGELRLFNGFDTKDYLDCSNKELDILSVVICDFICRENITSYFELEFVTRVNLSWHKYVVNHSVFFKEYFLMPLVS